MLKELYGTLIGQLAAAGFTAYAEDAVPQDAAFPFVSFRIELPLSLHKCGSIALTCWTRSDSAHADRLMMVDALLSLVPPNGMMLPVSSGLAAVFRSENHAVTWPESKGALGACIRFDLRAVQNCSKGD